MKKKKGNHAEREACQMGSCGYSVNHIWLGIAVILLIMAIAVILGSYGF